MTDEADRHWSGSMPDAYDRWLGPAVFEPFAIDLAARVAARRPAEVLELAAGTGRLTRHLHRQLPGARITATDLNDAMVDAGRRSVPEAEWRQADALDLPFEDASFDAIVCAFGVMFFPDKVRAFAEMARVVRPEGSVLFEVWAPIETHAFGFALTEALARVLPEGPPPFLTSIPHGYHGASVIAADLADGGLVSRSIDTVDLVGHAPSAADIARGFCTGTPIRVAVEGRGLQDAIEHEITSIMGDGPVSGDMRALVVTAVPSPAI
jgi:SAM-dependent methyltransferase